MDGKKILGLIVGIVAFLVCFQLASNGTSGLFGGSVEAKLQKTADELNKTLPKQIDSMTRLDKTEAGPGKSFSYIYTINVNLTPEMKQAIEADVRNKVRNSREMKPILDAGVTLWYKYRYAGGATAVEFSIAP